jgi:hypothetical protein
VLALLSSMFKWFFYDSLLSWLDCSKVVVCILSIFLGFTIKVCGVLDCVLQEVVVGTTHWCCFKEFGDVLLVARLAFLLWWLFIVFIFCCVVYVFIVIFVLCCVALWCLYSCS